MKRLQMRTYDMVKQYAGQVTGRIGEQGIYCTFGQSSKSGIGRCEDSERTFSGEVIIQFGSDNSCFEDIVNLTTHDDIHNS